MCLERRSVPLYGDNEEDTDEVKSYTTCKKVIDLLKMWLNDRKKRVYRY